MTVSRLAVMAIIAAALVQALDAQSVERNPHDVQPERPTVATHAGTVAPGWLEIETGGERDQVQPSFSLSTPTELKVGVARNAQLSISGSSVRPAGSSLGFGDVAAGIKWRLADDAPVVGDFAVLPSVKFPSGSFSSGTGTGTTDASLLVISSHDFGDVSMDVNAGYTRRSGDGSQAPKIATLWTVSFGGPFARAVGWAAECYGYPATSGPAAQPSIVAFLGGPTVLPRPWLELDAGVILPITGPQPRAIYAGLVYNLGRVW